MDNEGNTFSDLQFEASVVPTSAVLAKR